MFTTLHILLVQLLAIFQSTSYLTTQLIVQLLAIFSLYIIFNYTKEVETSSSSMGQPSYLQGVELEYLT
jgi:hypothetical protein